MRTAHEKSGGKGQGKDQIRWPRDGSRGMKKD